MKFLQVGIKSKFLIKNILRGLLWLGAIALVFALTSRYIQDSFMPQIEKIYTNSFFFYGLFAASEIVFGLIPPEFFMMVYILNKISLLQFITSLFLLTLISYVAGVLNYFVGRNFSNVTAIKKINDFFLMRYQPQLKKYGKYLLLAGAVTPIPFSAVCMLTGIIKFPVNSFFIISMARIFRFVVYGWVLWSMPTT